MKTKIIILEFLIIGTFLNAQIPDNNPLKRHYGNGNYPVWTNEIKWDNVINMQEYGNGANDFVKFENARDELYAQGGGVLYYPAGTYYFTDSINDDPYGRGLMLKSGIVIRGEQPDDSIATDGNMDLPTKFVFPYKQVGSNEIPKSWNIIGIIPDGNESLDSIKNTGIAWIETDGAAVYFGGNYTFGDTWATAGAWYSGKASKGIWADRNPDGTHPMDVFAGASGSYLGAGSGRMVFGCNLKNSNVSNDRLINLARDKYDTINQFYYPYKFGARIGVYGSDLIIANNLLPKSNKCFVYNQTIGITQQDKCNQAFGVKNAELLYDYGKTIGIDVNKGFLNPYTDKINGYTHENVIIRDNFVYNHGNKGYEISGKFFLVLNNVNERDFLNEGDDVYGLGNTTWTLTLDGFYESMPGGNGCLSDNLSRAYDMAGAYGWLDSNWMNNTGSNPGNDGEAILWQSHGGMSSISSFAITNNTHVRGNGETGYFGGWDVDQLGVFYAWNTNPGWVGGIDVSAREYIDFSAIENNSSSVKMGAGPDTLSVCPENSPAPPSIVNAGLNHDSSYIEILWEDTSDNEVAFRIDRKTGITGNWKTISYRPRKGTGTMENEMICRDYCIPVNIETSYRVVAINCSNNDNGASLATTPLIYQGDKQTKINLNNLNSLKLFPNPAENFVFIENISNYNYLNIIDMNGKEVLQLNSPLQNPVDIVNLNIGIYIIIIKNNNEIKRLKLVVK